MFSGTQIYNFQLYALYNVAFTSVPIIWFTTWDKEYTPEVLLRRPKLYRIGIENVYFNTVIFWRWFFYAFWQGILAILIIFNTMTSKSPNESGKSGSMQTAGNFTLTCVVIVSNMKLLVSAYEVTYMLVGTVFASFAIFFLFFWVLTIWDKAADDYGVFVELMG